MTNPTGPTDFTDLERSAADVADAMRLATRLLESIAPALEQLRALQDALAGVQAAAAGPKPTLDSARAPAAAIASPRETAPPPALKPSVLPFPTSRPEAAAQAPAAHEPSHPARRTVAISVSRAEGPLDLVRVHSALEAIPGVSGLALTGYTRGRAGMLIETDRSPQELPLREALLAVFPEGVTGRWQGDSEFAAVIGPPSSAAAP